MGRENLFHKRKAETNAGRALRPKREIKPRYLIVCEGTKTEPNYLSEVLNHLNINPKLIVVAPNNGSSPSSVVDHAETLYTEELEDKFDKVYCVFDRDAHKDFYTALSRINKLANSGSPFIAITSNPCFEFWLLLHFAYSSASYEIKGKKSVGMQALSQLKKLAQFKKYSKGQTNVYSQLGEALLKVAMQNASQLKREMGDLGQGQVDANPWTNFDELIQAIQKWPKRPN